MLGRHGAREVPMRRADSDLRFHSVLVRLAAIYVRYAASSSSTRVADCRAERVAAEYDARLQAS